MITAALAWTIAAALFAACIKHDMGLQRRTTYTTKGAVVRLANFRGEGFESPTPAAAEAV